MDFFNKIGKKASEAYKVTADKTGKIAKETKLRMKMGELKSEINDIYEDIGKKVYENHIREEKEDISNELEEHCTKIDCLSDEIDSILKQCLELKDKKQCPNCYAEIEKDVQFCPKCGAKQEKIEEEPAKEVEIVNNEENENPEIKDKDSEKSEENETEIDESENEENETEIDESENQENETEIDELESEDKETPKNN